MTGPAGIGSTAAAPTAGATARPPEGSPDDAARSDAGEFAAFAELFAYIESDDAAAGETVGDSDGKTKRTEDDDKPPPILLAEMMHYQWFGGNLAMPVSGAPAEPSSDEAPTDMIGLDNASLGFDLPGPVREFVARSADMRGGVQNAATLAVNAAPARLPSAETPPLPDAAAERLQPLAPSAPPSAPASPLSVVESAELPASPTRASASEPARRRDALATDIKANLLALETVLSRSGSASKESMDRSPENAFVAPPFKEVRISSVQQETHFAPGLMPSPILQIADHIDQDMRSAAVQALQQPTDEPRPETGPVRVLHIQLDPPQLGPLTIRIALKDGALNLQLETARHETASLIQTDKEALTSVLRSAGYIVDGVNVQVTAPDRPPAQQFAGGGAGGFNQAAGQQSGSRQSDGHGAGRSGPIDGLGDASAGSSHDTQGPQAAKPRGGSVYL